MRLEVPEQLQDTWARVSNLWARMPARLRGVVVTVAAALIMLFVVPAIWPHAAPRGQILVGAEFGAVNGLLALGLVLTYRASRVINFSYGAMGALAATVGVELYLAHHVNWFVCIAIALVVGAALGLFVDAIIRWRFFTAPRLIVMVVTIGLAQLFGGIQLLVPGLAERALDRRRVLDAAQHAARVRIFPVLLQRERPPDRHRRCRSCWSRWAGSSCGPTPASPCARWPTTRTGPGCSGIPVRRLSTLVWVIAGVIAGLDDACSARRRTASTIAAGAGPALILPALAAAIIAGMENLPLAFGAGVALGITSGLFEFNLPRYGSATGDVVNLVAILLGLLFLQKKRSRADDAEETFSATGHPQADPRRAAQAARGRGGPRRRLSRSRSASSSWSRSCSGRGPRSSTRRALLYGIIAISLVVLTGWSGNVSLGQFAFAGVGGVVAGDMIEKANVDLFLCLAAAGAAGALLAVDRRGPGAAHPGRLPGRGDAGPGRGGGHLLLEPDLLPEHHPAAIHCARCCGSASTWRRTRPSTSSASASWC